MELQRTTTFKKIDTAEYERWFHRILSHWHLFLISLIIAYAGSYFYVKYTTVVYTITASVLVKDASQNINPFDPSLKSSDAGFARTYNLNNDIKIFQSKRLIEETVRNMDWKVTYFVEGNFKNTEVYRFSAFRMEFPDSNNYIPYDNLIGLKVVKGGNFELQFKNSKAVNVPKFRNPYHFNQSYTVDGFTFSVNLPEGSSAPSEGSDFILKINSKDAFTNECLRKFKVAQFDKSSTILTVSTNGPCIEKEKDFINNHCLSFVKISLTDKNVTNERVINFIDGQLGVISDTLLSLEEAMIRYRKRFNSSNVELGAEKGFMQMELLQEEKNKMEINRRYLRYLKDYLEKHNEYTDIIAPVSVGIEDPILNGFMKELIELKMKQNITFKTENTQSPFRQENEKRINKLKSNISEIIRNIELSYNTQMEEIEKRILKVSGYTTNILDNEKSYVNLKRKYKINEELHNLLLKKKSEMSIVRAGNVSDTKIVDNASISGSPVPNVSKIYSTNLLIALFLPLIYVLFKYMTNYRIMEKEDVVNACEMPFLGSVGHIPDNDRLIVINKPKSGLAESFRSIRANLQYFLPKEEQKTIVITSSLSGEGKTFTSLNIASILAVSGKKVVLVGADMRKPKVYLDINVRNVDGLSNYLANKAEVESIIRVTSIENLFFISSGSIPPNPAELLMSSRLEDLLKFLRQNFDYIIIDTPPIGLVTDAYTLMKYSDINIFVVRHNYTQTKFLKELNEKVHSGLIKNIIYILNDFDIAKNYGYGYRYGYRDGNLYGGGYGYGYYEEDYNRRKNLFSAIRNLFKKKNNVQTNSSNFS